MAQLLDVALAQFGRNMQAVTDALFPSVEEPREGDVEYEGRRYGWYPEKPRHRTTRRSPI